MTVSGGDRNWNRGVSLRAKTGDAKAEFWLSFKIFKEVSQAFLPSEPHLKISCTAPSRSGS